MTPTCYLCQSPGSYLCERCETTERDHPLYVRAQIAELDRRAAEDGELDPGEEELVLAMARRLRAFRQSPSALLGRSLLASERLARAETESPMEGSRELWERIVEMLRAPDPHEEDVLFFYPLLCRLAQLRHAEIPGDSSEPDPPVPFAPERHLRIVHAAASGLDRSERERELARLLEALALGPRSRTSAKKRARSFAVDRGAWNAYRWAFDVLKLAKPGAGLRDAMTEAGVPTEYLDRFESDARAILTIKGETPRLRAAIFLYDLETFGPEAARAASRRPKPLNRHGKPFQAALRRVEQLEKLSETGTFVVRTIPSETRMDDGPVDISRQGGASPRGDRNRHPGKDEGSG